MHLASFLSESTRCPTFRFLHWEIKCIFARSPTGITGGPGVPIALPRRPGAEERDVYTLNKHLHLQAVLPSWLARKQEQEV